MIKRIKNNTNISRVWQGQEILPGEYYVLEAMEEIRWATDINFLLDIENAAVIINNGQEDILDPQSAISYIKTIYFINIV